MADARAAVVFDIFGTLFSLEPLGERLERAGLSGCRRTAWRWSRVAITGSP